MHSLIHKKARQKTCLKLCQAFHTCQGLDLSTFTNAIWALAISWKKHAPIPSNHHKGVFIQGLDLQVFYLGGLGPLSYIYMVTILNLSFWFFLVSWTYIFLFWWGWYWTTMLTNVEYVHLLITFSMAFVTIKKIGVQDFLKNKKWQIGKSRCSL
jgi:hypothetical protein